MKRAEIVILVMFLITNTALSTFLVSRSFRGGEQRDRIECLLLIQPQDRTPAKAAACRGTNK